ncbi:hypothetical protein M501DRAFT_1012213 [Patellaria atrata CBS 101060]|uniref:Uncharacterized protein n=1 Tax=Patellaria atrata CBS 101060 TaxID=1346257 RepID=A0A9P4VWL2_9PEZI|nr:hypothetical protein M501DRAFT_1012213 [Patellaria atrata CBS 101060]
MDIPLWQDANASLKILVWKETFHSHPVRAAFDMMEKFIDETKYHVPVYFDDDENMLSEFEKATRTVMTNIRLLTRLLVLKPDGSCSIKLETNTSRGQMLFGRIKSRAEIVLLAKGIEKRMNECTENYQWMINSYEKKRIMWYEKYGYVGQDTSAPEESV